MYGQYKPYTLQISIGWLSVISSVIPLALKVILPIHITLFKTEELFLINYPVLLTPDLGCIYHENS